MSIMDLFRSNPQPAALAPAPTPASPTPAPNTATNGLVPGTPEPKKELSAEEKFGKIWEAPVVDPNAPPKDQPIFNLDPEALNKSASSLDFSKMFNPEIMAKVTAGGEDAAKAFMETMNSFGRGLTVQNAQMTAGIVQKALDKQKEGFEAQMQERFTKFQSQESVGKLNPAFSAPEFKPMVEGMRNQIQLKNPNANAEEISKLTHEYFDYMATKIGAPAKAAAEEKNKVATGETDWSQFA